MLSQFCFEISNFPLSVPAQSTVDLNVITGSGTGNVDGPKVIDWFVTFTVKSVNGSELAPAA
jgi:hypothetical protein